MRRLTLPHYCLTLTTLGLLAAGPAHADLDQVRFGVSPWPGVTVKTEIAAQLLDAMGYRTEQKELAVGVILNGLANGQLDAYLGNWYPVQQEMTEPLLESGRLAHAAANISNANSGLVVPAYVHEAGVDSVADLDRYRERFGGKIQGIEAGTGINDAILKAIAEDKAGLGDWQLQESSTAAMLAYAGQKIADHEWVTFVGWEPHWMNVNYDLYYLKDADDSGVADIVSTVWTLVPGGLEQQDANLYRFFSQYRVDIADQNDWVYQYSHEERPADEVASEWIQSHEATVAKWLEGVTAKNGKPASEAVRAEFAN